MRTHDLGDGEPSYAVVAGIHGDEPCGVHAIEHVLAVDPAVREPVRLVVANEPAIEADDRYVDEDLNRAFPGDPAGDTGESRLAAEVLDAIGDATVLDLHSTVSSAEPFAVVVDAHERDLDLAAATGTDHVVEASYVGGGLLNYVDGVAVECGRKGSNAAAGNAVRIVARFLAAVGVVDDPDALVTGSEPPGEAGHVLPAREHEPPSVYRIAGEVEDADATFRGENFVRVDPGETFAAAADGTAVTAERAFYPVLMSTDGYEGKLGYRAERLGTLDEVDPAALGPGDDLSPATTAESD